MQRFCSWRVTRPPQVALNLANIHSFKLSAHIIGSHLLRIWILNNFKWESKMWLIVSIVLSSRKIAWSVLMILYVIKYDNKAHWWIASVKAYGYNYFEALFIDRNFYWNLSNYLIQSRVKNMILLEKWWWVLKKIFSIFSCVLCLHWLGPQPKTSIWVAVFVYVCIGEGFIKERKKNLGIF